MTLNVLQKGFNFSQDGPGNRLVIHLQGCNLHCPWCSNPESMSLSGGTPTECEEIVDEIVRCRPMFFEGGGVTLTGGEPTVQLDAVKDLLFSLKQLGINTAIETNGTSPRLSELFDTLDFLIMDFKHFDAQKFEETVGGSHEILMKNLLLAGEKREQLLLRIPLIGGFNSTAEAALGFAAVFKRLPKFLRVEVLRYHEYGKDKWVQCGKSYVMHDAFVSDNEYKAFCEILRQNGIQIIKT